MRERPDLYSLQVGITRSFLILFSPSELQAHKLREPSKLVKAEVQSEDLKCGKESIPRFGGDQGW